MRLISFRTEPGSEHIGALLPGDTTLVDFTDSDPAPYFVDMLAFIDAEEKALQHANHLLSAADRVLRMSDVKICPPLRPRQMRDFVAFEKHVKQGRANRYLVDSNAQRVDPANIELPKIWYQQPLYYKCNRLSVIGPGQDIVFPTKSNFRDYELEFGAVIARKGKNIPLDEARSFIFGYCIFNDASARDLLTSELAGGFGPCKGKDFDTGNVLGPWLVTAEEIPDPYSLTMVVRVNGEERSRGSSADMHHRFEEIIAHVSSDETIYPGEFLGSGTVGNGCGLELGKFLNIGDIVELEVTGLGTLSNQVR